MSFRSFSYTKKNRFDYPVWVAFLTFLLGSGYKQLQGDDTRVQFLVIPFYLFTIVVGYKNYYTWRGTCHEISDKLV